VFGVINVEREYQDGTYNPEEATSTGVTRRVRDLEPSSGIAMLSAYVRKAEDAWVNTKGSNLPAIQQIAKIAAIAVRILERAGGSEDLLIKGLR
jgi:hypothetical protein